MSSAQDHVGADGLAIHSPMHATVVLVRAHVGEPVRRGGALVILESMKMEHIVAAPFDGVVRRVVVGQGDVVEMGATLVHFDGASHAPRADSGQETVDLDDVPEALEALRDRLARGRDDARPEAVARRRATGQRTARENIGDLCDSGTFVEYGALVVAAQRQRRPLDELVDKTPADGLVTGIGHVDGNRCVVLAYDYTVLAGTQGVLNHRKTDRMLDVAARERLPIVFCTEGGGGRPGDTDTTQVSGLDVPTFHSYARLSGQVPRVGIASGRCFAGNAALLGCSDVVIATRNSNIGMAGPAMIEGGGLGVYTPEQIGPSDVQVANGVIDILVEDEAAAVAVAKRYLGYFHRSTNEFECVDQRALRHLIPQNRRRVYEIRSVVEHLADTGSVLELRAGFGRTAVTALIRIEGRPVGLIANDPAQLGGAIDSDAADKLARFLQLCDAFRSPIVSLCDTPGFMVGPEAEQTASVRHMSRLFVAGASLTVPVCTIVLRKGYGLGAQAMAGGSFVAPVATVAWPTGEIGGMGLEGAVRLAFRAELAAIDDPDERQRAFDGMVALAYERGKAVSAASVFELDAVIDPADTRQWIVETVSAAPRAERRPRFVDTW